MVTRIKIFAGVVFFISVAGWSAAQQVADYDPVLVPHLVAGQQFCDAAPECARMRWVVDANGNRVKRENEADDQDLR